jgi:hypothetical protein
LYISIFDSGSWKVIVSVYQGILMNIDFEATIVDYGEAIGGDIVQVLFAEDESEDEDLFNPTNRYLCFSSNYELDACIPQAEWFDGNEVDGGVNVVSYKIGQNKATIQLENGYIFHIHYQQQKVSILSQIRSYLARECCEIDT